VKKEGSYNSSQLLLPAEEKDGDQSQFAFGSNVVSIGENVKARSSPCSMQVEERKIVAKVLLLNTCSDRIFQVKEKIHEHLP
jgi:hypothetical protein